MTRASAQIVNFSDFRQTGVALPANSEVAQVTFRGIESRVDQAALTFEDLYPNAKEVSPLLHRAHELIAEAVGYAVLAHQNITLDEDLLSADENLSRIAAILPELFCLRSIGDGFGMFISALHCALVSNNENSAIVEKIWAVRKSLEALVRQPFLEVEAALDLIELLQDAGFETVAPELSAVAEALGD